MVHMSSSKILYVWFTFNTAMNSTVVEFQIVNVTGLIT